MIDKPRIRTGSSDYKLWVLGLWHESGEWDKDIPKYNGLFSYTKKAMREIQNRLASEIINEGKALYKINATELPITIDHINPKLLSQTKRA